MRSAACLHAGRPDAAACLFHRAPPAAADPDGPVHSTWKYRNGSVLPHDER